MRTFRSSRSRRLRAAAAAAALLAACAVASGPPELVIDRTPCGRCGMLVSEPAYAAAYRTAAGAQVFDDAGCLLAALAEEPGRATAEVWFRDLERDAWVPAAQAVFVRSKSFRTPMGGGIVALADRAGAERLARRRGGEVIPSFAALKAGGRAGGVS